MDESAINGTCVAEGELFTDTYSCPPVNGPPGDPAMASASRPDKLDPARLDDPDLAWVREQMYSCSCVCCHATPEASDAQPSGEGRFVWDASFEPAWVDSATDHTLRGIAGLDNSGFTTAVIPPEDNHGFSRGPNFAIPSTDLERLAAFAERELGRRAD